MKKSVRTAVSDVEEFADPEVVHEVFHDRRFQKLAVQLYEENERE